MTLVSKIPDKGDPSDIVQLFPDFNLKIHCCRYWKLNNWEINDLAYPYWRLYHNDNKGGIVIYKDTDYFLDPKKVYLIPPNTSYSTRIKDNIIPKTGYCFSGKRLQEEDLKAHISKDFVYHLFIHFNLGSPYDSIPPSIYEFPVDKKLKEKLTNIKRYLLNQHTSFGFYTQLTLQALITGLISEIPDKQWVSLQKDKRILAIQKFIESNLKEALNNDILAEKAMLATNAFNRLFTEEAGISPQRYVKQKRIESSCALLHHSDYSIEQVASECGFADRYHFSKIFKKITGISPARYRKEFGVK